VLHGEEAHVREAHMEQETQMKVEAHEEQEAHVEQEAPKEDDGGEEGVGQERGQQQVNYRLVGFYFYSFFRLRHSLLAPPARS
jgi:hypothetical protein